MYSVKRNFCSGLLAATTITSVLCLTLSCKKSPASLPPALLFDSVPVVRPVIPMISEVSGLADSRQNTGMIWVHEDSGNPAQLYLLGHDGALKKVIPVKGMANRDWEDISLNDGKLFIADIGDNSGSYPEYYLHFLDEPSITADTIRHWETIRFVYADGARDAEALIVDPITKDVFILTKRDIPSRIYKIAFPYNTSSTSTASFAGSLGYSGVVSAAISADGRSILVKTYDGIQYYSRAGSETIPQSLAKAYTSIKYVLEPQGEAIGFAQDGGGFFTLSEKGFSASVNLYFYQKR